MKRHNIIIIATLVTLCLASCKKGYLEVKDNSNLNRQSYVKDLNSMKEFMNGVHLLTSINYGEFANSAYPSIVADELKAVSLNGPLALHNNWSQIAVNATTESSTNNSKAMNRIWMDLYKIIRACDFVIEDIDKYADQNQEKANNLKGQAYAIRALVHLRLVNIFAQHYSFTPDASHPGIPYITTSDISKPYSRQTVAEVYRNLITDLESAISLMQTQVTDTRYMNKSAAKALLSRIYLYKGDYVNAKSIAVELNDEHPLMSINEGYPDDIFKFKPEPSQTEVLFQLTPIYKGDARSGFAGLYYAFNYVLATNDISIIIQENTSDIRKKWVTNSAGIWKVTKFPEAAAGGLASHPAHDYYMPVIRSSELFLIAAEACAKTNDEVNARLYLNAIRKRADPSVADVTANGVSLLDSIYKERRKELCFEEFRMWDLQRWKQRVHRTDVFSGFQTDLPYPSNRAIAPIPGQDVSLMRLQQNPSY